MLLDQAIPNIKNINFHSWLIYLSEIKTSLFGGFYLLTTILAVVFLPTNTDFKQKIYDLEQNQDQKGHQVIQNLHENEVIRNTTTFKIASWLLGYYSQITPPGLYQVESGWNNWRLIRYLQTAPNPSTQVIIKPYQLRSNALQGICKNLDIKYTALRDILNDPQYLQSWGPFDKENIYCILFADTLQMFPDSRAKDVADRLMRNYLKYWTPDKLEQAASLGLTAPEVGILASIVYAETKILEEMPVIAGLYLNRLDQEMRLQADPTVVYAAGRPLSRVLKTHKRIRSDYNTYRVSGLPPGPVSIPTQEAIDGVLSAANHDYLFFCARYDFSGYHHFSKTWKEHQKIAQLYQKELNKRRIGFKKP